MKQNRLQNSDIQQNHGNTFVFKYLLQQKQKNEYSWTCKKIMAWNEGKHKIFIIFHGSNVYV